MPQQDTLAPAQDSHEQAKPLNQEVERRAYIVDKLRSKRERLSKLPVEKQLSVYGVAFDRFVKPTLARSKLDDKAMDLAKDRWITGVVAGELQKPLPSNFAVVDSEKAPASAAFAGVLAGVAHGAGEFTDWLNKGREKRIGHTNWLRDQLREAEKVNYDLALGGSETAAKTGAAVGKALPSVIAFEAGAGAVPALAKGTPLAWRALAYLTRTTTGTAASTVPFGKTTTKDVAEQTAVNIAFDALFHGAGKGGAKVFSAFVNKAKNSGKPSVATAANAVDQLFSTVAKEKFPGKPVNDLNPEEFDAVFKESSARRGAAQTQAREAAKAVKSAQSAAKPSVEAQALAKAQAGEQRIAERKLASERGKFVSKQLAEYKKRVGTLPAAESEHFQKISAGQTVDQILGEQKAVAVQRATEVGTQSQAKILSEGAPTAVEAVSVVKQLAQDRRAVGGTGVSPTGVERRIQAPQIGTPGEPGIKLEKSEGEILEEQMRLARATEKGGHGVTEEMAREHVLSNPETAQRWEQSDAKAKDRMLIEAKNQLIKARTTSKATTKKESLFNVDISKIQGATTPDEFASAKRDAIAEINRQAIAQARSVTSTKEKMAISAEANKEIHRVRSAEVPATISKKAIDAGRKAKSFAEGQAELTRSVGESASTNPEDKLVAEIDRAKAHEKWFKENNHNEVYLKVAKQWGKTGFDMDALNEMLDEAKAELEKK